jgi:chorismate mutase
MRAVTSQPDLEELRRGINAVDEEILKQLRARVRLVLQVGEYKRERGLQVYDPARESELYERLCGAAEHPLDRLTVRRVFERIVDECRRIEQHHVE